MSRNYEVFHVEITKATDKAVLCEFEDGDEAIWIPRSQIEDNGEDLEEGYEGDIYITEWIAGEKGLL